MERCAHQILDKVDFRAVQQAKRNIVNNDGDAVALEQKIIVVALIVEAKPVLKPRAATTRNGNP